MTDHTGMPTLRVLVTIYSSDREARTFTAPQIFIDPITANRAAELYVEKNCKHREMARCVKGGPYTPGFLQEWTVGDYDDDERKVRIRAKVVLVRNGREE